MKYFVLLLILSISFPMSPELPSLSIISSDTSGIAAYLTFTTSLEFDYELYIKKVHEDKFQLAQSPEEQTGIIFIEQYRNTSLLPGLYNMKVTVTVADGRKLDSKILEVDLEEPTSVSKSRIMFEKTIQVKELNRVTVQTITEIGIPKTKGGDIIYMRIRNNSREVIANSISRKDIMISLLDNSDGTYTGIYEANEKGKILDISVFLIKKCGSYNTRLNPINVMNNKSIIDYTFKNKENLWLIKIIAPETRTYSFRVVATGLYVNSLHLLRTPNDSSDTHLYGEYFLKQNTVYDFIIENSNHNETLTLEWDFPTAYTRIQSAYWLCSKQIDTTHIIEVTCGSHHYMTFERICKECDFRCLTCNGEGVDSCLSCDLKKEGVIDELSRCSCAQGYVADTLLGRCVKLINSLMDSSDWQYTNTNLNTKTWWQLPEEFYVDDIKGKTLVRSHLIINADQSNNKRNGRLLQSCPPVAEDYHICPGNPPNRDEEGNCVTCTAGEYSYSGSCVACPVGTIAPNTGTVTCQNCQAGYYNPCLGATVCQECSKGTYSSTGASACQNCPEGTYNPTIGASSVTACELCEPGTYNPNKGSIDITACLPCEIGTYNDKYGQVKCTKCDAGTYNSETGKTSCQKCPKGSYSGQLGLKADTECTLCPIGTHNPEEGKTLLVDCLNCEEGKYNDEEGRPSCYSCPRGHYSNKLGLKAQNECTKCPIGTYNPEKGKKLVADCLDCIAGTYNHRTGQDNCFPCPKGSYSNKLGLKAKTECTLCPKGTYNPEENKTFETDCLDCKAGTYNNEEGQEICKNCPKGYYSNKLRQELETDCIACLQGTYNPEEGKTLATDCLDCPAGTYNKDIGQEVCKKCPKGYYSEQTKLITEDQCVACPKGTYNPEEGQDSELRCLDCPAGTYNDGTGKEACIKCSKGFYTENVHSIKAEDCKPCPIGTYNPEEGQGPLSMCFTCIAGTYNDQEGQEVCKNCPKGYYSEQTGLTTKKQCKPCRKGTYNKYEGQDSSTKCLDCPAGTFNNEEGQEECKPCKEGFYSDKLGLESESDCIPCPKGTYNKLKGMTSEDDCLHCLAGTYNDELSQKDCKDCPKGHYSEKTKLIEKSECTPCPMGTYTPYEGQDSLLKCLDCPKGTYNDELGQESCKNCPIGRYSEQFKLIAESECTPCPIGTYNPVVGQDSLLKCLDCPKGTYNDQEGQEICKNCPVGHYSEQLKLIAKNQCTPCPIGTYNPEEGQNSLLKCLDCPIGSYNDELGRDSCEDCEPGTANPSIGSSSKDACVKCKIMFYNPLPRQRKCLPCEVITFNTYEGAIMCHNCNRLCNSCYGITNNDCNSCVIGIDYIDILRATRCNCLSGYFDDPTKTVQKDFCQPCHYYCRECYNTYDNCLSCIKNTGISFRNGKCLCDVPAHYEKVNGDKKECIRCHPLCLRCNGNLNTQCDECDLDTGATLASPRTCKCPAHYYYDDYKEKCIMCNGLCKECFGSSNFQCNGCDAAMALRVFKKDNTCVSDCSLLAKGYYRDNSMCKLCHEDCLTCTGPTNNNCLTCTSTHMVMYKYECIDKCPNHHVAVSGVCFECYITCKDCSGISIDMCLSCIPGYYLWKGECLLKCPLGTYSSSDNAICILCPTGCKTCLSEDVCTSCSKMYFLKETSCVLGEQCSTMTYPNEITHKCDNCFETCLSCIGGTNKDCTVCDFRKGYRRSPAENGECYLLVCSEGTYLNINYEMSIAECPVCNSLCRTCKGGGSTDCVTCAKDTIMVITSTGTICKKCPTGYKIIDGQCQEICGDGLNLGKYECDDGNNIDGDGCSAECTIEDGFRCNRHLDSADVCVDIRNPKAALTITKGTTLVVTFSELVLIKANSLFLSSTMLVFLKDGCKLTWSLENTFHVNQKFTQLKINTQPECSLYAGVNFFVVHFTDSSPITDMAGNELVNTKLEVKTMRYTYVNANDQEYSGGVGTILNSSSIITLGFMIFMSLFQSADVGYFWSFVNMAQMISYLPAIECELPYTLELVLTKYLNVKKLAIPWNMLPNINFNPLAFLEPFLTNPLSDKFLIAGYDSLSFIYNFADELTTWILLAVFYLFLTTLCSIVSKKRWKKGYEYNGILRILIECYLNMNFCAILNISKLDTATVEGILSLVSAYVAMFLSFYFLLKVFWLLESTDEMLVAITFNENYGTLLENIKMLWYFAWFKPFNGILNNALNIFNEIVLLIAFSFALLMNTTTLSNDVIRVAGWILVILVMSSLVIAWTSTMPVVFSELCKLIRTKEPMMNTSMQTAMIKATNVKGLKNLTCDSIGSAIIKSKTQSNNEPKLSGFTERTSIVEIAHNIAISNEEEDNINKKSSIKGNEQDKVNIEDSKDVNIAFDFIKETTEQLDNDTKTLEFNRNVKENSIRKYSEKRCLNKTYTNNLEDMKATNNCSSPLDQFNINKNNCNPMEDIPEEHYSDVGENSYEKKTVNDKQPDGESMDDEK